MGPYLTTPKKEKEVEDGEGTKVSFTFLLNIFELR